jgi:type II secretory pathway pseudopilin PulG
MMKRKSLFTLLEVLIALGLTLMILTFLLLAYAESERTASFWREREEKEFSKLFLQRRLGEVFRNLLETDQEKAFFFTTDEIPGTTAPGSSILVFSYDNGFLRDAALSKSVLAALFVDIKGTLNLITWPARGLWGDMQVPPFHREALMEDLSLFQMEFFPMEGDRKLEWTKEGWSKERKDLPGAIKITATKKNEAPLVFYFPIPTNLSVVRVPK